MSKQCEQGGTIADEKQRFDSALERAKAGDDHALDAWLPVLRSCLRHQVERIMPGWLRAAEQPSDFVQEAMMLGCANIDVFRGESLDSFRAYFLKILRNRVKASVRQHTTAKRDIDREVSLDACLHLDAANDESPLDALEAADDAEQARKMLKGSDRRVRKLIRELCKRAATVRDAASKVGVPERTAHRWLAKLRQKLRGILYGKESTPPPN